MTPATGKAGGALAVQVDGAPLAEDAAREMWRRFSAYMEAHRGDLAGFAKSEGFVSAHPRSEGGRAVLILSKTAPQEAYGVAPKPASASPKPQGRPSESKHPDRSRGARPRRR